MTTWKATVTIVKIVTRKATLTIAKIVTRKAKVTIAKNCYKKNDAERPKSLAEYRKK